MSARHHAATFSDALDALDFYLGWAGGWMPIQRRRGQRDRWAWRPAGMGGLPHLIRTWDERYSDEIVLGLPQAKRWNGGVGQATILWCRIEGADQLKRARAFKPRPTVVLQEGSSSRRLLMWALEEPVTYFDLEARNRKIAYALAATQKHGDPDALWIPAPGTCLRVGRSRPVPVVVGRLTTDTYMPDQVTRRLREPPAKDAWRERFAR